MYSVGVISDLSLSTLSKEGRKKGRGTVLEKEREREREQR
jgi:hypothetical protein